MNALVAYCMAESNRLRPSAKRTSPNARQTGIENSKIEQGFRPATRNRRKCFALGSMRACPLTIRRLCRCSFARCASTRRSVAGTIAVQIKEVGSGAVERELREKLMAAARRREIDVVLVWRLDRWGRSLADLVVTLKELARTRRRFRVADRSSRSDYANGPRDGWSAVSVRRVRT